MARKSNGLEKYALGMSNQVHGPSVFRSGTVCKENDQAWSPGGSATHFDANPRSWDRS